MRFFYCFESGGDGIRKLHKVMNLGRCLLGRPMFSSDDDDECTWVDLNSRPIELLNGGRYHRVNKC